MNLPCQFEGKYKEKEIEYLRDHLGQNYFFKYNFYTEANDAWK
jgi:hypothetical protein